MFVFSELCVRVASEGGRKANEAELVRVQHGADANYFPYMYTCICTYMSAIASARCCDLGELPLP